MTSEKKNVYKLFNLPWYIFAIFAVIVIIATYTGTLPGGMAGCFAFMIVLGTILYEIGEHAPIIRSYLGGGAIVVIFGSALLNYFHLLPTVVGTTADGTKIYNFVEGFDLVASINTFFKPTGAFLDFYIAALITGSILGMNRKLLVKAAARYFPAIFGAIIVSFGLTAIVGTVMGFGAIKSVLLIALPIMGGGAGAGAVPMAQVYSDATGQDSAGYLSFCMAILALGNIVAILMAVVMDLIGRAFPKMTGHGELLRVKNKSLEVESKKPAPAVTVDDIAAAIFICAGFFMLGQLVSKKILPTVFGVAIPNFAYMIIFAALANIFNLIPENLREACRRCQHFCGNKLVWIQMVGMGISAINFSTMFSVASWQNVVIVLMIVIGCCVGSALFGWIVGFFPVESAITAGLCMANMGGAGDLAVLGAAKRMDLMVYAQISSRIGGAIVLLIASILFAFL